MSTMTARNPSELYILERCLGYNALRITLVCHVRKEKKQLLKNIFQKLISNDVVSVILTGFVYLGCTVRRYFPELYRKD